MALHSWRTDSPHFARAVAAGLALVIVALSAAGCGGGGAAPVTTTGSSTPTTATPGPCFGGYLAGTFNAAHGHAAAGQVSYVLTLANISQTTCVLTLSPAGVSLEDAKNASMATHAKGSATATELTLEPGDSAAATVRFSTGAQGSGRKCEAKARQLSINPGEGTVEMTVKPSVSVCDGTLDFGSFVKR